MSSYGQILQLLQEVIEAFNDGLASEQPLLAAPDTLLVGNGATLDSLGFVNFVVMVEEALERQFGLEISVVDMLTDDPAAPLTVAQLAKRLAVRLTAGAA